MSPGPTGTDRDTVDPRAVPSPDGTAPTAPAPVPTPGPAPDTEVIRFQPPGFLARRPAAVRWAVVLSAVAAVAALVGWAAVPAGAPDPAASLDPRIRFITAVEVTDGTSAVLGAQGPRLVVLSAHRNPKGWRSAEVGGVPQPVGAAVTRSAGGAGHAPFVAVYGRIPGADVVRVRWSDGTVTETPAATDGSWLVARPPDAGPERVEAVDSAGRTLWSAPVGDPGAPGRAAGA